MKWVSHKIITGATIYTLTGDVFATIASMAGSVIPDVLEGMPDNTPNWRKYHRGLTHWFVPYLSFAIILLIAAKARGISAINTKNFVIALMHHTPTVMMYCASFFLFGCSMHIFQDYFCGQVPSLNPKHRMGRRLFYVGSQTEYVITLSAVVLFVLIMLIRR